MKAPPYFPFFQRDFVHSCRTAKMSPDDVGALVMVMCQQWEEMGPISKLPERFAAYTGWDIRVARRLLTRLVMIGKIEQHDDGYRSERMADEITKYVKKVRASEEREARKRAEISRTSSELLPNIPEKSETCSPEVSENRNENSDHSTTEDALPDIRYQISEKKEDMPTEVGLLVEEPIPKTRAPKTYSADFEEFWDAFPVKDGKWAAFDKSWRKLIPIDRQHAIRGAGLYAERVRSENIEKPKWAQGWLTDRRWEDELRRAEARAKPPTLYWWQNPEKLAQVDDKGWDLLINKHANGTWPVDKLGWPPRHPKHVVPDSVIVRRGLIEAYDDNGIARGQLTHV